MLRYLPIALLLMSISSAESFGQRGAPAPSTNTGRVGSIQPVPPAAQVANAIAATTAPAAATAPVARKELVVPPGFKLITEGDHTVLVEPSDEAWVKQCLLALKPTTMPTTMPTELLAQIHVKHDEIVQKIVHDLALPDKNETEKFISEILEPAVQQMEAIHPRLFYIVTTEKRLAELMRGGWTNDRFYYNRIADAVQLNTNINISSPDDLLLPAIVGAEDVAGKSREVQESINQAEARILQELAALGMIEAHRSLRAYVILNALPKITVKDDQAWFVVGVGNVLAARYFVQISGAAFEPVILAAAGENPNSPIRSTSIDLLHAATASELRPEGVPIYRDAYNRKASRVIYNWMVKAGEDALPKVLTEMRKNPPTDGEAMIKQIQQVSGIDLTQDTRPGT